MQARRPSLRSRSQTTSPTKGALLLRASDGIAILLQDGAAD